MRSLVAISLVISLLFAGNAFAIKYTGSEHLAGYVLAEPHSGGGGDSFELPVDFQLSMTVDLDPFQSLTITDFTIQATPVALDFPDFNGNVTLTIDELLFQQTEAFTVDLNPAVGGVFETPHVDFRYSCCQVELSGKWDNFGLHENLASKQSLSGASQFFDRAYEIDMFTIAPSTYLDGLEFVTKFQDSRYDRDFIAEIEFRNAVNLEPHYRWKGFYIPFPNDTGSGVGGSSLKSWVLDLYPEGGSTTLPPHCDFSSDGVCGVADINQMFDVGNLRTGVVTSVTTERFDLIDNDIIDAADITEWLSQAATENGYDTPFSRGDINLDYDVDTRDLTAMIIGFTSAGGTGKTWNTGDTDGDGDVDSGDLTTAIINFTGARNSAAAVPEPTGLLLLLLAVGCLAAARGRSCRR